MVSHTSSTPVRNKRIEARLTAEQKALLRRAATLQGSSLSEFVVMEALRAAEQLIRERTVITLADQESKAFVTALLDPPSASEALRSAVERYRQAFPRPEDER